MSIYPLILEAILVNGESALMLWTLNLWLTFVSKNQIRYDASRYRCLNVDLLQSHRRQDGKKEMAAKVICS